MKTLKVLFRNMKRGWAVSIINIAGLVLGITSTVLILGYVFYERSYDSYHKQADNVYRLVYDRYRSETLLWKTANTFYPSGNYLKEHFPEVVDYFHMVRNYNVEISLTRQDKQKNSFFEEKTYFASPPILRMLDIPLVTGNANCLDGPNKVIISERMADKYFKGQDPLGKIIKVNNGDEYNITAVYQNQPQNTHIKSDFFFSFASFLSKNQWLIDNWQADPLYTYIQLKPGTDYSAFSKKAFSDMVNDNYGNDLAVNSERDEYYLQPVKNIHLYSAIEWETEPSGNGAGVSILLGFAIFFILIAWINYVNLVTARSMERAKEVGIKKVCGSSRLALICQFIFEAFVFNLICIIISTVLIYLLMPFYLQLTGIENLNDVLGARFWVYTLLCVLGGILISSIYPALILSSFREVDVLKGNFKHSLHGVALRKGLVTFQLFLSLVLLIGTGVVYKQVQYLNTKDIGYNYHSAMIVKAPRINEEAGVYHPKLELLKNEILGNLDITGVTIVSDIPGKEIENFFSCYRKGNDPGTINHHYCVDIDPQYIRFFNTKILAGRDFTEADKVAKDKIMINTKAMYRIGFTDPKEAAGKIVKDYSDKEFEIIGVMEDMNYFSVKSEPMPTIFTQFDREKRYLVLKYSSTANMQGLITRVQSGFNTVFPGNAFDYTLLEDKVAQTTYSDKTFALIFGLASGLAIIISIIGIIGLIIITINQNLKALGIRKVLGADLRSVYLTLWRPFYRQFILASVIAIPVAYYGFTHWVLEKYVYHVSISLQQLIWPVFVVLALLVLIVFIFSKKVFSIKIVYVLKNE